MAAGLSVNFCQPIRLEVFAQFLVQQTVQQRSITRQRTKAIVITNHLLADPVHPLHNCIAKGSIKSMKFSCRAAW